MNRFGSLLALGANPIDKALAWIVSRRYAATDTDPCSSRSGMEEHMLTTRRLKLFLLPSVSQ